MQHGPTFWQGEKHGVPFDPFRFHRHIVAVRRQNNSPFGTHVAELTQLVLRLVFERTKHFEPVYNGESVFQNNSNKVICWEFIPKRKNMQKPFNRVFDIR
jgi:hypothetical protein